MIDVKDTLPDKLSALIRLGLADIRKAEAMPETYEVCMSQWHFPSKRGGACVVCMAGAAMAFDLGLPPTAYGSPCMFGSGGSLEQKLHALNCCAWGDDEDIFEALTWLGVDDVTAEEWRGTRHVRYEEDRERFHAELLAIADKLEAAGL